MSKVNASMQSREEKSLRLYEDYLQCALLLHCVKKCIQRPEISPELKLVLYDKCFSYNCEEEESTSGSSLKNTFNPLGIDEDLLEKTPDSLTYDQAEELRQYTLEELRKFCSFTSSLRSALKRLPVKENLYEHFELLELNVKKKINAVHESLDLQKKIENVKLETPLLLDEKCRKLLTRAKKLLKDERKLFDEIVETMTSGARGEALVNVEKILEKKVNQNREKIDQMKFQLSEYSYIEL